MWYAHPSGYWAAVNLLCTFLGMLGPDTAGRGTIMMALCSLNLPRVCGGTMLIFILDIRSLHVADTDSSMKHMEGGNIILTLVTPTQNMWQDQKKDKDKTTKN